LTASRKDLSARADALGRRIFLFLTFLGSIITSILTYSWFGSLGAFMVNAFVDGAFTFGFAFSWMAFYLVELFMPSVRATAASFVFNEARLIAWVFSDYRRPNCRIDWWSRAALTMSSVYVIGLIVPYFMPETVGKPLPA
jgi:hypothetical protein